MQAECITGQVSAAATSIREILAVVPLRPHDGLFVLDDHQYRDPFGLIRDLQCRMRVRKDACGMCLAPYAATLKRSRPSRLARYKAESARLRRKSRPMSAWVSDVIAPMLMVTGMASMPASGIVTGA